MNRDHFSYRKKELADIGDLRGVRLGRREMLRQSSIGFGYLAAAALLGEASKRTACGGEGFESALLAKPSHFPSKAKRAIFLFMKGGPSHLDTFDYKPQLQKDDGKELPFAKPRVQFAKTGKLLGSPWKFARYGQSGSYVSELFPNVAKHVDDLCFIHSLHGTNAAHGGALLKLHTGSDAFVRPSLGAWVSYGLGTENSDLPGFVTICPTLAHGGVNNWGSAFLPAIYQGTPLGNASMPSDQAQVRYIKSATGVPRQTQREQLDLLRELHQQKLQSGVVDDVLESRLASMELAFRMQAEMPMAEDLQQESEATHRLYGLDEKMTVNFGRQCLLARRLIERGVRYVQVTHSDAFVQWDQHSDLKKGHEKNAKEVDLPISGLLTDLKQRGLLDDTLVIWSGEFGRTPVAEGTNGRDHNPEGFTVWFAGGGVKGGFHFGSTDEYGYYAAENKVHLHDFHATILALLGLDHEKLTYRYAGRDFRLTDVHGEVAWDIFA
jgi:hypothetical protein